MNIFLKWKFNFLCLPLKKDNIFLLIPFMLWKNNRGKLVSFHILVIIIIIIIKTMGLKFKKEINGFEKIKWVLLILKTLVRKASNMWTGNMWITWVFYDKKMIIRNQPIDTNIFLLKKYV